MKENWIPALATAIIFLAVGIVCLFWPKKIQQFGLDYYARHRGAAKFIPFLDWMSTESYLLSLRIIGLAGIAVCVLFVYVLIIESLG
jgi:hypothetical protein